jgi:hypothetical protein
MNIGDYVTIHEPRAGGRIVGHAVGMDITTYDSGRSYVPRDTPPTLHRYWLVKLDSAFQGFVNCEAGERHHFVSIITVHESNLE